MRTADNITPGWLLARTEAAGECREWSMARQASGYGATWCGGKVVGTHRLMWQLARGPVPHGMHVLHKCDNRPCINPDHLFVGTNAENVADKMKKNRQSNGNTMASAKLTAADVRKIRSLWRAGRHEQREIAKMFGISPTNTHVIIANKTWRHA